MWLKLQTDWAEATFGCEGGRFGGDVIVCDVNDHEAIELMNLQ